MFRTIKLYFTDRSYYEQRKRYIKRQKAARKKLKTAAKTFCPWSGSYMHDIIKIMLDFYHATYLAGDCCWSEEGRIEEIATSLGVAVHWANKLEKVDELEDDALINIARNDKAFDTYLTAWKAKVGHSIADTNNQDALLASLAQEYLTEKYTKSMYKIIGEHIWDWCD